MPTGLLFFGVSWSVQHCLYTICCSVPLQRDPFALQDPNSSFLGWIFMSHWGQNCYKALVLLYNVPQQRYMASRLLWQINRVFLLARMSLRCILFFWISPKSGDSLTVWFLLPCTMQGETSRSGKQLQNETKREFTHWKNCWRWCGLRMILLSYLWKLGSVCLACWGSKCNKTQC